VAYLKDTPRTFTKIQMSCQESINSVISSLVRFEAFTAVIMKGNYEECRLPGYKTAVRTSQKTHYYSAIESSQLMLCKI
jgi:hypothetical protein